MSRQLFLTSYPDTLEHVLPLSLFLKQKITARFSPFHKLPLFILPFLWFISKLVLFFEKITGKDLFIVNDLRDFAAIDSRARRLLADLLRKEIIVSWRQASIHSDLPPLTVFLLTFADQKIPSGQILRLQGNVGQGYGKNVSEAMLPALAETLERYSLCAWNSRKLLTGSYKNFRSIGAVDPCSFVTYSQQQLTEKYFEKSVCDEHTSLHWINAESLVEQKTCYVPAQTVFINFDKEYPDEPVFGPSTTNGAAAAATREEAIYKGLCEGVERDGFLMYWLNTISPRVITVGNHPTLGPILESIKKYGIDIHILDTRTELGIPSFCAVTIDRTGQKAVSVSAGAGFDVNHILEKLLWDSISHLHFSEERTDENSHSQHKETPRSFKDRKIFWSDLGMINEIDFFIKGEETTLNEIIASQQVPESASIDQKLECVLDAVRKQDMKAYAVDVASSEAKHEKLSVIQTIVPALIPMYFDEKKKPLGVKRLYTVPQMLGYANKRRQETEMNEQPHPFI